MWRPLGTAGIGPLTVLPANACWQDAGGPRGASRCKVTHL